MSSMATLAYYRRLYILSLSLSLSHNFCSVLFISLSQQQQQQQQRHLNTHIMKFSSSSSVMAAALLVFLPTAASEAPPMPTLNCPGTDQACIDEYSKAMSDWANQVGNDASAQSDACNAMPAGSTESIACWKKMGDSSKDMLGETLGDLNLFGKAEDIDVEDMASKDESSSALLRSTMTSITVGISIVAAAIVLVVA